MFETRGLTVVEALVVLIILLVLVVVAVPTLRAGRRADNERRGAAALRQIANAEAAFRSQDSDNNGRNDYWTGDVSGLYRIAPSASADPIKLIDYDTALADGRRLRELRPGEPFSFRTDALPNEASRALSGYHFQTLESFETRDAVNQPLNDGTGHHAERFGFIAYPESYGSSGQLCWMISESGLLYVRNPRTNAFILGKPPTAKLRPALETDYTEIPLDPAAAGWQKQ